MRLALWLIVIVSAIVFALLFYARDQTRAYNAAVKAGDWQLAEQYRGVEALFAKAKAHQERGDWQAALSAYGRIESEEPALNAARQYNMANIYLRQALAARDQDQLDLALPLSEMSKQAFRHSLSIDPEFWDASYNLERVLQAFPDPVDDALQEWMAPERGPRAVISIQADQELP